MTNSGKTITIAVGVGDHDRVRRDRLIISACAAAVIAATPALAAAGAGAHGPASTATVTSALPVPGLASPGNPYVAHLRLQVSSTSNWTRVLLQGLTVVSSRFSQQSGDATWSATANGIDMSAGDLSSQRIVANLVVQDVATPTTVAVQLQKGNDGRAAMKLSNIGGHATGKAVSITDKLNSSTDPANTVSRLVPRSQVMGTRPLVLPRADPRRLVLAFYYPWFGSAKDLPAGMSDKPAPNESVNSKHGVDTMTAEAKANGVNGFVVSWAGEHFAGKQFRLALDAATKQHQVITGYLEALTAKAETSSRLNPLSVAVTWLVQLLRYSHSPAFLKAPDGTPVVFVYGMPAYTPAQWTDILGQVRNHYHLPVDLVGDELNPAYLPLEWGLHDYPDTGSVGAEREWSLGTSLLTKSAAVLAPGASRKLFAATVSPGFDDLHLPPHNKHLVISRSGGSRYRKMWGAAVSGEPDWIVITSWNEWFEGTEIQPGKKTGDTALHQTKLESRAFHRDRS